MADLRHGTQRSGDSRSLIAALQDEFGRVRIPFDESQNRPGEIEVDGDVYVSGPVVILHFKFSSEHAEYLETLNNEIDFGTFRLTVEGTAKMDTNVTLLKEQVEILIAALQWQIRPVGE